MLAYRLLDDTEFKGVEPVTSTQAYVLWLADGTAIFAFRGTESACGVGVGAAEHAGTVALAIQTRSRRGARSGLCTLRRAAVKYRHLQ